MFNHPGFSLTFEHVKEVKLDHVGPGQENGNDQDYTDGKDICVFWVAFSPTQRDWGWRLLLYLSQEG